MATRSGVLCVGTVIVDVAKVIDEYPEPERLTLISDVSVSTGGPALNLAVDLRRLGAQFPLDLVGVVGIDAHARVVHEACAELAIGTRGLRAEPDVATSFTDAMVVRDGGTRTFFHHPGANALLAPEDVDVATTNARILHAGAPGLHRAMDAPAPGDGSYWAELLRDAQTAGIRTTMELVSLPAARIRALALPCLPHLDYLVINDVEAAAVTGIAITPTSVDDQPDWRALESAAVRLTALGVARLAVIHLPGGCVAAAPDGTVWRQGSVLLPGSSVRNATGAGDAFAAGVIYGLHEGLSIDQCLRLGVCAAAASVQGVGTSDGIQPATECLAMGERHGLRSTDQ